MRSALLACLLAVACALPAAAGTLDRLRGQYRALVVFMPTDTGAREAIEELARANGFAVRDTVWFVIGPEAFESSYAGATRRGTNLARLHRSDGFEAILIGMDGGIIARQVEELDISAFIDTIDTMPIRPGETRVDDE